jgi:hypothetical protein
VRTVQRNLHNKLLRSDVLITGSKLNPIGGMLRGIVRSRATPGGVVAIVELRDAVAPPSSLSPYDASYSSKLATSALKFA